MIENFKELFEQNIKNKKFYSGAIIDAIVIDIQDDYIILNSGLKSESIVSIEEFKNKNGILEVNIGDTVKVVLDSVENGHGETLLSREKAKWKETWEKLSISHENNETIMGLITGKVKGGFTVEIDSIRAFLPGSLVDIRPIRDPSYLEGKELEFKVIKMDIKRNNIVVSRRAVIEEENSVDKKALLSSLHEGKVLNGIVKNLTDYGAFIDLGGIDGLLHITDISWKRIRHPNEILHLGQDITIKVLNFDSEKNRVSLGMKQLSTDPWNDLTKRYSIGSKLQGKITNITDYGCFVEIESGIEGLVHTSEMDWNNKNINPNKIVSVGDMINVMILEIDVERRRISLGIKQCLDNPWNKFAKIYNKGQKISGKIRSITEFGIFVSLEHENIDGLIHISDISHNPIEGEVLLKKFKKGQKIEAIILSIDIDRERISLGLKQLNNHAFLQYVASHPKGTIVVGKIISIDKKVKIKLDEQIIGILQISEDNLKYLKINQDIEVQITGFDKDNFLVFLEKKNIDSRYNTIISNTENNKDIITTIGNI